MNVVVACLDEKDSRTLASCLVEHAPSCDVLVVSLDQIFDGCLPPTDILFVDACERRSGESSRAESSVDAVRALLETRAGMQVVYILGDARFISKLYETQHACAIMRPFSAIEILAAFRHALELCDDERRRPLRIRSIAGERVLSPQSIVYIESCKRILCLHTRQGVVSTYARMRDLSPLLPQQFVHCHKSFVVNLDYLDEIGSRELKLTTGDVVPVSQGCRKDVAAAIERFLPRVL
ncbi:LytTR family transcriptional regulator DNA-binding domain-containing protein [Collinsella tanakaei]|nr:LytTR family transcriptional regulator DNA-binding domain-containing protein [Collinsella tanakaei]